jgi:Zn-dependent M28 family amino/carboxypeptidase
LSKTPYVFAQDFSVPLAGRMVPCANIVARIPGANHESPLLLGTHFDTRLIADNEPSAKERRIPILGANDGGSGTAILLALAATVHRPPQDVYLAFFDAEDVGNIDGNPFSVGAAAYVADPIPAMPAEAIILDMVGGRSMVLDIDAHSLMHRGSYRLTQTVFRIGLRRGVPAFAKDKPNRIKYIICDHFPFLKARIPATILIDIDYPEWHTAGDTPEAMDEASLQGVYDVARELAETPRDARIPADTLDA